MNHNVEAATVLVDVNLTVDIHDAETGRVIDRQEVHNRVTDAGLTLLLLALMGTPGAGVTHFATGTGTAAIQPGDTTLQGEVTRETVTSKSVAGLTMTVKYYMGSTVGNGNTIRKVGLFNAGTGGTLIAAALLASAIPKSSAVGVTYTWTITLASAS